MKRITFRIGETEHQVLKELTKDGRKLTDVVRTALIKYLHSNHQPIYEAIWAENRRRNEEILKSYYARQAQERAQTSTE